MTGVISGDTQEACKLVVESEFNISVSLPHSPQTLTRGLRPRERALNTREEQE